MNVAGFELAVMRDHRPQLTMNVVVGKAGTQTPIFKDTLEHVVDERRLSGRAGASVGKRAASAAANGG